MPSICGVCNLVCEIGANDVIKCSGGCDKYFHLKCIKDDLDGKKTRSSRDWKCKECRTTSSTKSSSSSATSTLTKDFLVRVMEEFKKEVFGEIKNFKKEVTELSSAVQFLSDKMDTSNSLLQEVKAELAAVKEENTKLHAQNAELDTEVNSLRERLRELEQYTRRNNVEISGIPVTSGENVFHIVKDLGTTLGVAYDESQVVAAHRIPSFKKGRSQSIIVQFHARATRDAWISKFRENKTVSANQVNSTFPQQPVYVNEHLSPENKLFLARLKQKCKDVGYTYVWCRDGKFFVRKNPGDSCKRINNYDELTKLK